jgi:hypothetical protein
MRHKLVDGWAAQHEAERAGRQRTSMTQIGG